MLAFSFGVYSMAPCVLRQGVALVLIAVREQTTLHRIAFVFVPGVPGGLAGRAQQGACLVSCQHSGGCSAGVWSKCAATTRWLVQLSLRQPERRCATRTRRRAASSSVANDCIVERAQGAPRGHRWHVGVIRADAPPCAWQHSQVPGADAWRLRNKRRKSRGEPLGTIVPDVIREVSLRADLVELVL